MGTPSIPPTLEGILDYALNTRYFHPEDGGPAAIPLHYVAGKVPLVAVVGPNAGGKSFLRRIVGGVCRMTNPRVEFMGISMAFRTGGGAMRSIVLGSEEWEATGQISARTVTTGIKTCRSRDNPHVVFWDEPDIGLSEGYSRGVGQSIARFASDLPTNTVAAFVVSHSKPLVREFADLEPHYLHVGSDEAPLTRQAWLDTVPTPLDIDELATRSYARFKLIQKILDT